MDWAFDEARRRGAEELYLTVFIENHRARRFYDRYGFEAVGPLRFHGRQPRRRGHHHAEGAVNERRSHPRGVAGGPAARLPRAARRGVDRRDGRPQRRLRQQGRPRRDRREPSARDRGACCRAPSWRRSTRSIRRDVVVAERAWPQRRSGRTPTRWSPTARAAARHPHRRLRAGAARRRRGGRDRRGARRLARRAGRGRPRRRSRRWSGSAPSASGSPPRSARASRRRRMRSTRLPRAISSGRMRPTTGSSPTGRGGKPHFDLEAYVVASPDAARASARSRRCGLDTYADADRFYQLPPRHPSRRSRLRPPSSAHYRRCPELQPVALPLVGDRGLRRARQETTFAHRR